jgi:predicted nuclease of predicted toxin-antitoxin system
MTRLYADEQFPKATSEHLRALDHDLLTVQEAGNAGDSDPDVLSFATADDRTVVTQNRRDFIRLHRQNPEHTGIIVCSVDQDSEALANRINTAILAEEPLAGKLIRVVRPAQ